MLWLTWRQFRAQAVTAVAALAVFAVLLAITGPHLASLYAASGITGCHDANGCANLASIFLARLNGSYPVLYVAGVVIILVAPAIVGMFWGAPLIARELETGTFRLIWNQSITRTRWLVVKLTTAGLAAMAVTGGLSLLQAWWAAPLGRAVGRGGSGSLLAGAGFSSWVFATHGITPLGYAAFAFALGVTTGVLVRRAVPAMAITLAVFAAVQIAMPLWIRPHLFPPVHTTAPVSSVGGRMGIGHGEFAIVAIAVPGQPNDWVISSGAVNAAGQPVSTMPIACIPPRPAKGQAGGPSPGGFQQLGPCLSSHGIRVAISYQPASRYWAFQWTETAIYLALSLALAGYCCWRLAPRRLA